MGNDASTFRNKNIELEFSVGNARNTNSQIDVYCRYCEPEFLKIEYKSGPTSIDEVKIRKEFIERDLYNADNLNQIQWRLEGTYFTREQLVVYLQQNREVIEDLGIEKIQSFFPEYIQPLINEGNMVDKLIQKLESNEIFNQIFKGN